jgi:hypothetical protein
MFGTLGLPELLVLVTIGFLIFGSHKLVALSRSAVATSGEPSGEAAVESWLLRVPSASADFRYAQPPVAGTVAELFGLGWRGLRWRQAAIVVAGLWLSIHTPTIWYSASLYITGPADLIRSVAWPVFFVFAAITALRSCRDGIAVACVAGLIHAVLFTSFHYAFWDLAPGPIEAPGYLSMGARWFASAALTVSAIQLGVRGPHPWIRLAICLFMTSLAGNVIVLSAYEPNWRAGAALDILARSFLPEALAAAVLTATFWLGSRISHARLGFRSVGDAFRTRSIDSDTIGVERFLPAVVMAVALAGLGFGLGLPLDDIGYQTSTVVTMTSFVCPLIAAMLVASGRRSGRIRVTVAFLCLVALTGPFLGLYQIQIAIALTGTGGIGAVSAGLSDVLLGVPFVLSAVLSLAIVMLSPRARRYYRTILVVLTIAVGAGITVDILAIRDFMEIAATGSSPERAGWLVRWLFELTRGM